jgi:hypothetical protein
MWQKTRKRAAQRAGRLVLTNAKMPALISLNSSGQELESRMGF